MDEFYLSARWKEVQGSIFNFDEEEESLIYHQSDAKIYIGRVKKLKLIGYAVFLFPTLQLHKENNMEELYLNAGWRVCYDCGGNNIMAKYYENFEKTYIGKVKKMKLFEYALILLPTLQLHKENNMEELYLSAEGRSFFDHADDAYSFFETIVSDRKGLFEAGKLEHLKMGCYAVIFLPF
ncbi:MAG: uncharacterized protein A8A55_3104 [Amphiamblys sp. WSBS2006]|nr:MAG: uncharacterized protein A8A55_3104 [Amphiamblys sp. WSBS2006]